MWTEAEGVRNCFSLDIAVFLFSKFILYSVFLKFLVIFLIKYCFLLQYIWNSFLNNALRVCSYDASCPPIPGCSVDLPAPHTLDAQDALSSALTATTAHQTSVLWDPSPFVGG